MMPSRVRKFVVSALVLGLCGVSLGQSQPATRPAVRVAHDGLRKLSWQLAVPTGTFGSLTVFGAIDRLHGFGVHHLELTPGQRFSDDLPALGPTRLPTAEAATALLAKLKSAKMDVVTYGPVELGHDEAFARSVFAFAKSIKAKAVVATTDPGDFERLDALATQAGVTLAVRGGGNAFTSPGALVAALANRSKRVTVCDDIGEWTRAGVDPLAATRAIGNRAGIVRLLGLHAGALDATTEPQAADYVSVLEVLKQNGFKGIVTLACTPGADASDTNGLIESMNALSDAITRLASAH